jgi:hypothetical protein
MKFSSALGKVSQAALFASQFVLHGVQATEQLETSVQVSPWQFPAGPPWQPPLQVELLQL